MIPNYLAVFNFPGRRMKLFPDFSMEEVEFKRLEYEKSIFLDQIFANVIIFERESSAYNEAILKKTLSYDEIAMSVHDKLKLKIKPKQLQTMENLNLYGPKKLKILDYYYPAMGYKINIDINIMIKKI